MRQQKKDIMQLYHYSDKSNIKELKTSYFNNNSYTYNDYKISQLNRIFCYYDIGYIEYRFLKKYKYTCNINKKDIYNLNDDKLHLKNRYKYNIDKLIRVIKKIGYSGILYDIGNLKIVNIFSNIDIKMEVIR